MRSVKVADYMARPAVTFSPNTSVIEAMNTFLDKRISGAPVVADNGELLGVLSEADVMKIVIQDSYYDENVGIVSDYMHSPAETIPASMDIYSLAERFLRDKRRRYPVVSNGKLVGQISRRDVLRAASEFLKHR
ncbi:MAG: CBS domain-containing protein [Pseudomonadaceae bacterium]|nr:CBS domain-containing protein [Pseudomonadaceae bacterium]